MSGPGVAREAFVLPLTFLTVGLAGGFRTGATGELRFLPPPLICLVLALLLLGLLVRGGVLVPGRLLGEHRSGLENVSGSVVLVALFLAGAQVLNSLTPEAGLLHLAFNVFFAALFSNTLAAGPDRARLLRSLLVVFGWALVLKYVVLEALYDPTGGLTRRVAALLLEGLSLGTLEHRPAGAAAGYVSFVTVVSYLVGLVLLPRERAPEAARDLTVVSVGGLAEPGGGRS
jgi:hypothetical protein